MTPTEIIAQWLIGYTGAMTEGPCLLRASKIVEAIEAVGYSIVSGPHTIPMILFCPKCGGRHIDEGEFATKVHHTHSCQHCGVTWRPAIVPTVGVQFLPGFKNE